MPRRTEHLPGAAHLPELPATARLSVRDLAATGLAGLRGRPVRAVLSALGIAIGIAAMVAVAGISSAGRAGLMAQIDRLGTDLLTVSAGQSMFGEAATLPRTSPGMISRLPGVRAVSATGVVPGATVRRSDAVDIAETGGIAVQAAELDLLATLQGRVRSGVWLNRASERYPAVVLGAVAARRLGIEAVRAPEGGTRVYLAGRWFSVVGVLDTLPLAPELDRSALVGWPVAERSLGFDGHPGTVYERSRDDAVASVGAVLANAADPEHPEQVEVSRPSDALAARLAADSAFDSLFLGLGAVALLVGGVGIANIMVISVLERRQEIGLRRAIGATRGQIRGQFLTESVLLSLLGGLAGMLFGLAVTWAYAAHRDWPAVLPWPVLAGAVLASVLVGAVAGVYPARRAARLNPTQALSS